LNLFVALYVSNLGLINIKQQVVALRRRRRRRIRYRKRDKERVNNLKKNQE